MTLSTVHFERTEVVQLNQKFPTTDETQSREVGYEPPKSVTSKEHFLLV
jgi:hypothetical protein